MKRKTVLLISSIVAASMLVGGAFAAYAVTDYADSLTVDIRAKSGEDVPITIEWGTGTTKDISLDDILPGHTYKAVTLELKSSLPYTGDLEITLSDNTLGKTSNVYLIDFLRVYLYEGGDGEVGERALPSTGLVASSSLGGRTITYKSADGSPAGNAYSVYIEFDLSSYGSYHLIEDDIAHISFDWNEGTEVEPEYQYVYFSTPTEWGTEPVYLYSWDEEGNSANAYPGVQADIVGQNEYYQIVYRSLLNINDKGFIFTTGANDVKTADIYTADYPELQNKELLYWVDGTSVGSTQYHKDEIIKHYDFNMGKNPGPILHAWGWTTENVKNNLNKIKEAGYSAVQLSPLQPNDGSGYDKWYMLYQPKGFSVAKGNANPLGNADSLAELTAAADELGIDIIVDVIANHLAAGSDYRLDGGVNYYEETIYNGGGTAYLHTLDQSIDNDYDTCLIVQGNVGKLPDLKTETSHVQERVISMLKEYIDCGVKGFRFDAAKHIETPEDGDYKSFFWPNVIGAINEYGMTKYNKAPYSYGEILGAGTYRSYQNYTKYIDISDNQVSNAVKQSIVYGNSYDYNNPIPMYMSDGVAKQDVLLFTETHDHYKEYYDNPDARKVNMGYAIETSRANVSTLYFARPSGSDDQHDNTKCVITNISGDYYSPVVSSANKLHNEFNGGSEYLNIDSNGFITNLRQKGDKYGALICDPSLSRSQATLHIEGGIADGTYLNLVTNEQVVVTGGNCTVSLYNGVAVIVSSGEIDHHIAPTSGYAVKVVSANEINYYTAIDTATESYGKHVYKVNNLHVNSGDKLYMFNGSNGNSFNCVDADRLYLEQVGSFTYYQDYILANVTDTFNVELQLAYEDDSYYIYK